MTAIDVDTKWLRTRIRIARANLAKAEKARNIIRIRAYEGRVKYLSDVLELRLTYSGGTGVPAKSV